LNEVCDVSVLTNGPPDLADLVTGRRGESPHRKDPRLRLIPPSLSGGRERFLPASRTPPQPPPTKKIRPSRNPQRRPQNHSGRSTSTTDFSTPAPQKRLAPCGRGVDRCPHRGQHHGTFGHLRLPGPARSRAAGARHGFASAAMAEVVMVGMVAAAISAMPEARGAPHGRDRAAVSPRGILERPRLHQRRGGPNQPAERAIARSRG
jgi:hypothetical protein